MGPESYPQKDTGNGENATSKTSLQKVIKINMSHNIYGNIGIY